MNPSPPQNLDDMTGSVGGRTTHAVCGALWQIPQGNRIC
jgi:hypothetical protein